jgi:hypothetical protein
MAVVLGGFHGLVSLGRIIRILLGDSKDYLSIIVYTFFMVIFFTLASNYCALGTSIIKKSVESLNTSPTVQSIVLLAEAMKYPRVRTAVLHKLSEMLPEDNHTCISKTSELIVDS